MLVRCMVCNDHLDFNAKKGKKLGVLRCTCGGRYEPMYLVRTDERPERGWSVYRNYNNVEYHWDVQNGKFILIIPTATP